MTLEDLADALRGMETLRRKIVICPVGKKLEIETLVLRYNLDQWWTVQESRHCPADVVYVVNDLEGIHA
jgi:hypothetical protein